MSYKIEVKADSSGTWAGNGLAFASQREALDYGKDLAWRWTAVREIRAVESDEPVNYRWNGFELKSIGASTPVCKEDGA